MISDLVKSWLTPPAGGWHCGECGIPLEYPGVCDDCGVKAERRWANEHVMERVATIPAQFRWATFDNRDLVDRASPANVLDSAAFARDLVSGRVRNLVFLGPAGAGKTSLACAALRYALTQPMGFSGRFCAAVEVAASRSDSGLGSMPAPLRDAMVSSVIVLDDLGQEQARHSEVITELMQSRHNAAKPTIVTSWLEPEAIAARYGDGTARRILEHAAVVRVGAA